MPNPRAAAKRVAGRLARRLQQPWQPQPAHWGLTAGDAGLALHGSALTDLAERHGTPLHVVDFARLDEHARAMCEARGSDGSRALVTYSYKTNPVPGVLERLHAAGVGAEVVSPFELWLARELGVPGERLIYNGPVKSPESLASAIGADAACINVNSPRDLAAIAAAAAERGRRARIGFRVTVAGGWQGQFGFGANTAALDEAVRAACAHDWLEPIGVQAHRGLWIRSAAELRAHVQGLMAERARLARVHGLEWPLVDLGGSLACPTVTGLSRLRRRLDSALQTAPGAPGATLAPGDYARIALDSVAAAAGDGPAPRVVLEPGRGLTGDTQFMIATVLDIKPGPDGLEYAILDAGTHNAEPMRDEQHAILPLTPRNGAPARRYRLVGPLCTPDDVIALSVTLPALRIGDRLALMDSGAYFVSFAQPFSFGRPAVVAVAPDGERVLRRAEGYADIVARDVFAGDAP